MAKCCGNWSASGVAANAGKALGPMCHSGAAKAILPVDNPNQALSRVKSPIRQPTETGYNLLTVQSVMSSAGVCWRLLGSAPTPELSFDRLVI